MFGNELFKDIYIFDNNINESQVKWCFEWTHGMWALID